MPLLPREGAPHALLEPPDEDQGADVPQANRQGGAEAAARPAPWAGTPDAVQPEPLPARFPRAAPRTPPDLQQQGPRREGRLHGCGPSAFPQGDGEGRRGTDQGRKQLLRAERQQRPQARSGSARTCCLQPAPADWGVGRAELRPERRRRQEGDGHAEETAGYCARALRRRGRRRRRDCRRVLQGHARRLEHRRLRPPRRHGALQRRPLPAFRGDEGRGNSRKACVACQGSEAGALCRR